LNGLLLLTGKGKGKMDGNTKHKTRLCKKEREVVDVTPINSSNNFTYRFIRFIRIEGKPEVSRGCAVHIATGYELDDREVEV
jgi:hypothetical protein